MTQEFEKFFEPKIVKQDDELGLAIGFAIVSKKGGEDYYDTQGHNVPDDVVMKMGLDFALHYRVAGEMHKDVAGTVPFIFPLTEDVAKALEIETSQYGLIIGMQPSPEVYAKVKSGDYAGFSIGGTLKDYEVIEEDAD